MYRGPESLLRRIDVRFLASLAAATAGMSAVVLVSLSLLGPTGAGWGMKTLGALVPVSLGFATYVGLAVLFKVPEATRVLGMVRQRFGR